MNVCSDQVSVSLRKNSSQEFTWSEHGCRHNQSSKIIKIAFQVLHSTNTPTASQRQYNASCAHLSIIYIALISISQFWCQTRKTELLFKLYFRPHQKISVYPLVKIRKENRISLLALHSNRRAAQHCKQRCYSIPIFSIKASQILLIAKMVLTTITPTAIINSS